MKRVDIGEMLQGVSESVTTVYVEDVSEWQAFAAARSPSGDFIGNLVVDLDGANVTVTVPPGVSAGIMPGAPANYDVVLVPPGGDPIGYQFGTIATRKCQTEF